MKKGMFWLFTLPLTLILGVGSVGAIDFPTEHPPDLEANFNNNLDDVAGTNNFTASSCTAFSTGYNCTDAGYLVTGSALGISGDAAMTLEWCGIQYDSSGVSFQYGNQDNSGASFGTYVSAGTDRVYLTTIDFDSTSNNDIGTTKCLTWVHNITHVNAYRDGVLLVSEEKAMNLADTTYVIGQRYDLGDGMPTFVDHTTIWNEALNSTAVNESYQCYLSDQDKSSACGVPVSEVDVTFTAVNRYDASSISNFSINISGGFSNNTIGGSLIFGNNTAANNTIVQLNITSNDTGGFISQELDFNFTWGTSYEFSLWQSEIIINVDEVITGDTITTFNASAVSASNSSNSSGQNRLFVNANTYSVFVNSSGYMNKSGDVTVAAQEVYYMNFTIGNTVNFTALDRRVSSSIDVFTVNLSIQGTDLSQSVTNGSVVYYLPNSLVNVTVFNASLGYAKYEQLLPNGDVITNLPNFTILSAPTASIEAEDFVYSISLPYSDESQYGSIVLIFNGTNYSTTKTTVGNTTYYNTTINTPSIENIIDSFVYNWSYIYDSSTLLTESFTLNVAEFVLSSCTAPGGDGNYTVNFTIYSESNASEALVADLEAEFSLYDENRQDNILFNFDLSGNSNYLFCLKPNNASIQADATFKYTVDGGFTHRYYFNNQTLTNQTKSVSAYNLNSTAGTSTLRLTIRNRNTFLEFPGLFVHLQKNYIGEGLFRTVQMDKSGDLGVSIFNIFEQSQEYKILIYDENNTLLRETNELTFSCDDAICENVILVSPSGADGDPIDVGVTTAFNNETGILTVSWNEPTGQASSIRVIVSKDTFSSSTTICDESFSQSSGTTTCNTSAYSKPVTLQVFSTASPLSFQYTEIIGKATATFQNLIDNRQETLLYGGIITLSLGVAGLTLGIIGGVVGLITGLITVMLFGITSFVTYIVIAVVALISIIIAAKVK